MNKVFRALAGLLMVASVLAVAPTATSAEIAPYAQDTWGVYDSVTSGTLTDRIDNEVFAIEQIGNTIYVGGKFTEVRRYTSSSGIDQPFLAAFNASTGAFISSFDTDLDGPVYSLQASPDGSRLFVGGEFGDVEGVPNTKGLVALNPSTGRVDNTWISQLKRNAKVVVYTMDVHGGYLYVGGSFDEVGGAGIPKAAFGQVVKLRLSDARPDYNWTPVADGGAVWGVAVADDGQTVYLAGYFDDINNVWGTNGFVGVDNVTGDNIRPGRLPHNISSRKWYLDVVATGGLVFVAGMEHITYVLNESDLSVRTMHSTGGVSRDDFLKGGDYQDLEVVGDRVYASCHCRGEHFADGDIFRYRGGERETFSSVDPIKFVAAYSAIDGSYIDSFQLDISGSSGSWAVHGSPDGCLWIGGDITRATRADGTSQPRGGFTKHCDSSVVIDTERPSVPGSVSAQGAVSSATITWNASTDNVGVVGYDVYRATSNNGPAVKVGTSQGLSYTDNGLSAGSYWYYVRAVDAAGNESWRTGYKQADVGAVADTERPSVPTGLTATGSANSVQLSWNASNDNVGVVGYDIYRSTGNGAFAVIATSATPSYTDSSPDGTYTYYVRAKDAAGNLSWRSGTKTASISSVVLDNERPSVPTGMRVASKDANSVTLTWNAANDNVGVTVYKIYNADTGQVMATSATNSGRVAGLSGGNTYRFYVRAQDAAGNISWRSNTASVTIN